MSKQNKKQIEKWKLLTCASIAGLAVLVSGCGKTEFQQQFQTQSVPSAGSISVPPKVDILLAYDDSGSMYGADAAIRSQMPTFLANLEAKNWDYHLAVTPLTKRKKIDEVMVSKFDPAWEDLWKEPYPGADRNNLFGAITSGFSSVLTLPDPTSASGNLEWGFDNMIYALGAHTLNALGTPETNFRRSDSALVIMVIGNGDDRSGVNMCNEPGSPQAPCYTLGNYAADAGSWTNSLTNYKNAFAALRPNGQAAGLVRFYSAVSTNTHTSADCNPYGYGGFDAKVGTRYSWMSANLGGSTNIDLCGSDPVGKLLGRIQSNLTSTTLNLVKRVIPMDTLPNANEQIEVVKISNGAVISIPQSATNGWTLRGNTRETACAVEVNNPDGTTVCLSQVTSYLLDLHGSAILHGSDSAKVTFKAKL